MAACKEGLIKLEIPRLGDTSAVALRASPAHTAGSLQSRLCPECVCVPGWDAVVLDVRGLCHPPLRW